MFAQARSSTQQLRDDLPGGFRQGNEHLRRYIASHWRVPAQRRRVDFAAPRIQTIGHAPHQAQPRDHHLLGVELNVIQQVVCLTVLGLFLLPAQQEPGQAADEDPGKTGRHRQATQTHWPIAA